MGLRPNCNSFVAHSIPLRFWGNFGLKEDVAKWEAEFSGLMNAERDALDDVGKDMQMAYESRVDPSEVLRYDDSGIPELGPYIFGEHLDFSLHPLLFTRACREE